MSLAIFDLDETLLAGDSDYLWGKFLVDEGVVDREHYESENERFFRQYKEGCLDIREWLAFQLRPLADNEPAALQDLRARFLRESIEPIILPAARELVESHRARGHELLIITATNSFITRPIADMLGIDELLASEPECVDGRYTGAVAGIPSFREGKVLRLHAWLKAGGRDLAESWFYSDSHNDIPLLELVSNPVAVDPDPTLTRIATDRGWPIISLR
ncbi:MAG: HAD family hydrolase [Gammaproteobacteria bacterium]|nr:HAD family hydrolase [Gammaproteobacteria bacterium]